VIATDDKLQRATVTFPQELNADSDAKLALTFSGTIDGSMMGYYKSTYSPNPEKPEEKDHYALTQFEPTSARQAFPCWDEPALKATISFTHIYRSNTVSLANMNEVSSSPSDGLVPKPFTSPSTTGDDSNSEWKISTYAKSPKMSTYLMAWANGNFKHLESSYVSPLTGSTIPLRIYATPENIHQGQLALDTKASIMPIYEKIFDIAYPLPKMDTLVATDFDAGAMENWGLITGRTSVYLYDEENSGIAAQKLTTGVQSHEVAHQWFGNVVTMEWWDNLWLNEAFATLMGEVIIIQELHPEWKIHSEFINMHLKRALQLDSLRSSHPIEMPCPDASMINQIFDAISYSKGASVLKMLANSIGEKAFLKGVSIYLKKHLYSNSRTADLWAGIAEASGLDVAKVMANWTLKVGFPVVNVEETADGIKLRQNRFLSTGDCKPEEDETLWWIPLELKTVDESGKASIDHKVFLTDREMTIDIKNVKNATFKINAETAGVYRVNYTPERLAKLGEEASKPDGHLTLNDRMGLVQDATVLAKAGYGKTSGALTLMSKMASEKESLVWTEINGAVNDLGSAWWEQPQEVRDGLDALKRKLFGPIAKKLGFEASKGDSAEVRELRATAVGAALAAKEPSILEEAQRRFGLYVDQNDESIIPGDLRTAIFGAAVRNGGNKEYEKVLSVYRRPPTPQHKSACIRALTNAPTEELRKRTFDMILSDEVKTQDIMSFFVGASSYSPARRATWEYFKTNYDALATRFKGNFSFSRVVQYSFDQFSSNKDADAVEKFFSDKNNKDYAQALSQGLDSIRSKAGWVERDAEDVEQWLKSQK